MASEGTMSPGSRCHPLTPVSPQVTVVVKYLFQFGFFPWNGYITVLRHEGKPFFPPRIVGLEKSTQYIKYDLVQLLALFFHRSLLLVSPGWAFGGSWSCSGGSRLDPVGAGGLCRSFPPVPVGVDAAGWGVKCVGLGASRTPDRVPPQSFGLWDQEETAEERQKDKEGEEKPEKAVSAPLRWLKKGWRQEAPAQPGALAAATGPELELGPEGESMEQEEGGRTTQLRFRRRRQQEGKTLEMAPAEGEHRFPTLVPRRGARLAPPGCWGRAGWGPAGPWQSPTLCLTSRGRGGGGGGGG